MAEPRDLESLDPSSRAAEEAWAEEQTWPVYRVVITGDEVDYVARPGVNEDENGVPQPYVAVARAVCDVQAVNEKVAEARALADNKGYHTVESTEQIK
jgi:hypothetical protein